LEKEYLRLEPQKTPMSKTKTEAIASVRTRWLRLVDVFRTLNWKEIEQELSYLPSLAV